MKICALRGQRELEKDWYSTITEYVKPVFKDMPKTFETIEELLSKARGDSGVPLDYVIRTGFSPADRADNPGSNYKSKDVEMITLAPIFLELGVGDDKMGPFHDILQVEQKKLYDILFTIFSATKLGYTQRPVKRRNGGAKYSWPCMCTTWDLIRFTICIHP